MRGYDILKLCSSYYIIVITKNKESKFMGLFDKLKKSKKYSFIGDIITNLPKGLKANEINDLSNLSKEKLET